MAVGAPRLDAVVPRRASIVLPRLFFRSAATAGVLGALTFAGLAAAQSARLRPARESWIACSAFLASLAGLLLARASGAVQFVDLAELEKRSLETIRGDAGPTASALRWSVYVAAASFNVYMPLRGMLEEFGQRVELVLILQRCLGWIMIGSSILAIALVLRAANRERL
jgi:hypothetical protein